MSMMTMDRHECPPVSTRLRRDGGTALALPDRQAPPLRGRRLVSYPQADLSAGYGTVSRATTRWGTGWPWVSATIHTLCATPVEKRGEGLFHVKRGWAVCAMHRAIHSLCNAATSCFTKNERARKKQQKITLAVPACPPTVML